MATPSPAAIKEIKRGDRATLDVTFEKISGAIGSLLLVWAAIERSARDEVVRVYGEVPKRAHGIAAVLRTWEGTVFNAQPANSLGPALARTLCARLQGPLEIRNGICHGLTGISAAQGKTPAMLWWEINDEKKSISWDDLQATLGWLSKVSFAFATISDPRWDCLGSRAMDNAENRDWWLTEFALDLPAA